MPESETRDEKLTAYWSDAGVIEDGKDVALLKDFLAMANNPRGQVGRIVMGVKEINGTRQCGSIPSIEEANLREFIDAKLSHSVDWQLIRHEEDGHPVATMEIVPPRVLPVTLKKPYDAIHSSHIYTRRGTINKQVLVQEFNEVYLRHQAIKPSAMPQQGQVIPAISDMVDRVLSVFEAHGVLLSQIPRILPELNYAQLKNREALVDALSPDLIEKICDLFFLERSWLEGAHDMRQQQLSYFGSRFDNQLADEVKRGHHPELHCFTTLGEKQPQPGDLFHFCFVVVSRLAEFETDTIFRYMRPHS
jgi:hypothetical protein